MHSAATSVVNHRKKALHTSAKARIPDKHAGKSSVLFNDSGGVFSGMTLLLVIP
jgi:hypothetical protein